MIAQWMAYSLATSFFLALAALALEHGLGRRGIPLRALWASALIGSVFCSALPWFDSDQTRSADSQVVQLIMRQDVVDPPLTDGAAEPPSITAAASGRPMNLHAEYDLDLAWLDEPLSYLWLVASGLVALAVGMSMRSIRRDRRTWKRSIVEGVPACISTAFGPAVVGFFRTIIVLPEWVLQMDSSHRSLVIAHEEEHLRQGDPRLLALSMLAAVSMPWNLAVWWQIRRLRHAIEIDCDARVLKRCPDARTYASLLIEIGWRKPIGSMAIAAFAESSSLLARRIELIVKPRRRAWGLPFVAAAGLAVGLLTTALQLPRPVVAQPAKQSSPRQDAAIIQEVFETPAEWKAGMAAEISPALRTHEAPAVQASGRPAAADTLQARFQPEDVAALAAREYPPELRQAGIEGEATLRFIVDREGRAREIEVLAQNRLEFADAAKRVVDQLVFWAARVDGQTIESPVPHFRVRFRLSQGPPTERREAGSVELMLRAAIAQYYPELLREATARTPYVYLVVNERGDVVRHALDWSRPSTAGIRDAILDRFPDLPRTRSAVPGGAGSSVRTGIPGGEDIEVFWATVKEPSTVEAPIRWGPYPLDAVSPGSGFPHDELLQGLRERHQAALQQEIPAVGGIWYVASASGELLDTGIATDSAVHAQLRQFSENTSFMFMSFLEAANDARVKVAGVILAPRPSERGVISGRVLDSAGRPVAGAAVLFRDRKQGAVTRANGAFSLIAVPPGTHALIVRHPSGSPEVTRELTISADSGAMADFTLP